MGQFVQWLLADEQKETFELLYVYVLSVVFLGLTALVLWPLGEARMAWSLFKGYWMFWIVLYVTALFLLLFRKIFRVDIDTHFDAYVISAVVVGGFLQAGWSAFAALTARDFAADASLWVALALYFFGLLSCYVAFGIVSTQYSGQIYKPINLGIAVFGFALFALWPAAARATYGWAIDLLAAAARATYGRIIDLS